MALKAAITPKTKLVIMPFPNHPTGAVMEREDLEAVAQVLAMGAELRFSPHGATEAQRALALRALDTVRARWQEKTGPGRRFLARFVECEVL